MFHLTTLAVFAAVAAVTYLALRVYMLATDDL